MPFQISLTPGQLEAIDKYKANLDKITDLEILRRQVLNNYRQNLLMHNTYRSILSDQWGFEIEESDTSND